MCGIAGILHFDGRPVEVHQIEALTDALAHRGRDSAAVALGGEGRGGLSAYPGVALGHRRLSIIDLAAHSAQPMISTDRRTWIVYNGELYNYRAIRQELQALGREFRTASDSEVVLVAYETWGAGCLTRFNGMFAFAIWSEARQSLFCARDPIGIKPFYYRRDAAGFRFSSESKALVDVSAGVLDTDAVACYFLSMYVPRRMSIFSGVEKLLPGHWMEVRRDGRAEVQAYWNLPTAGGRQVSAADAAAELQGLLDKAVASQLQSDVPVGALLSGGFDSGMIVASAARGARSPLHTYSIGFEDAPESSELPIARSMAERYGTFHHERVIHHGEVIGMLDQAIASMSEPLADSAIVPTYCLSEMAATDGVKVLLSGTGGDEVFGGYSRYVALNFRRKLFFGVPHALRQALGRTVLSSTTFGKRLAYASLDMMFYTGGSIGMAERFFANRSAFLKFLDTLVGEVFPPTQASAPELYENMQFDLQVYLPDLLLMLLDQLTMAHTVEGRVPLLDTDLLAASFSLDPALHARPTGPETRCLMRRMAAGQLDPRTFSARKQGFSGPVRSWIRGNRKRFQEQTMAAREIPTLAAVSPERLWAPGAEDNNPFWGTEVFSLYCFITWYQTHVAS